MESQSESNHNLRRLVKSLANVERSIGFLARFELQPREKEACLQGLLERGQSPLKVLQIPHPSLPREALAMHRILLDLCENQAVQVNARQKNGLVLDRSRADEAACLDKAAELLWQLELLMSPSAEAMRASAAVHFASPAYDEPADSLSRRWLKECGICSGEKKNDFYWDSAQFVRFLGEITRGLPWPGRIRIAPGLNSKSAVGGDELLVADNIKLDFEDGRRIAIHEIFAHWLVRLSAKDHDEILLQLGCAGSNFWEEGRALSIEEKYACLSTRRKRELALRHQLALACHEGQSAKESLEMACDYGLERGTAAALVLRIYRGGGLGRERIYLPAYLAYCDEIIANPMIDSVFSVGLAEPRFASFLASNSLRMRNIQWAIDKQKAFRDIVTDRLSIAAESSLDASEL